MPVMRKRLVLIEDLSGVILAYDPEIAEEKRTAGFKLEMENARFLTEIDLSMNSCIIFDLVNDIDGPEKNLGKDLYLLIGEIAEAAREANA